MDGILIVDKQVSKTSFDVVRDVRKEYNTKKVGHIGTLDPMASGVLPVLIGNATRLSNILVEHDKEYIAVLTLGKATDTGDSEGKVIQVDNRFFNENSNNELETYLDIDKEKKIKYSEIITKEKIEETLKSFLGDSMQIPPMYSAIKINGRKLYEIARSGKTVEREPRKINISEIELLEFENPNEIKFRVVCSKGTYIRVLCEDIAKKIGTCGYMSYLRRTRVGNFKIEDAGKFIEMQDIFDVPKISIQHEELKKIANGVKIFVQEMRDYSGFANLYVDETYIGICEVEKGVCKRKIFVVNNKDII